MAVVKLACNTLNFLSVILLTSSAPNIQRHSALLLSLRQTEMTQIVYVIETPVFSILLFFFNHCWEDPINMTLSGLIVVFTCPYWALTQIIRVKKTSLYSHEDSDNYKHGDDFVSL